MRTRAVLAALCLLGTGVLGSSCLIHVEPGYCGGFDCGYLQCCALSCGGTDAYDTCVDVSSGCTYEYAPVCGCDGATYPSACAAHANCVAVAYAGTCASGCGGSYCASWQCCLEGCGGDDAVDTCIDVPNACTDEYAPVCGCDSLTYGNACAAHAACVAIDHTGACDIVCVYEVPSVEGCRGDTVECPMGGPGIRCVAPEQFDDCCCAECV